MRALSLITLLPTVIHATTFQQRTHTKGDANIKDVIVTLDNLLKTAQSESTTIDKDYDEVACSCRENTRTLVREGEEIRTFLEGKTVDKNAKDEDVEGVKVAVSEVDDVIKGLEKDVKDLTATISTKREECKSRLTSAEEVISACDQVLNQYLTANVQSQKLVSMVKKMRSHAVDKKQKLEGDGCLQTVFNDEQAKNAAAFDLKISNEKKVNLEGKLADELAAQAVLDAEIKEGNLKKDILDNDLKVEKQRCEQAAHAYDHHSALLSDELTGLTGAIEALKKASDVSVQSNSNAPSFIQIQQIPNQLANTVRTLSEKATALHSNHLATVALKIKLLQQGAQQGTKAVDFSSVLSMIKKMVKTLQEEELAEMSKTAWCAKTLEALKKAKDESQDAYNAAETAVKTLEVQIKRNEKSYKMKTDTKEENSKTIEDDSKTLQDQISSFETQLSDSERAEQAIQSALDYLNTAYGTSAETAQSGASGAMVKVKARNATGGAAVQMLNKLMGEFGQDADIAHMETSCANSATYPARSTGKQSRSESTSCEPASTVFGLRSSIQDLKDENAVLTQELSHLDTEIKQQKKDHDTAGKIRNLKLEMLDVTKQERATRQAACINAEDSYEARQARREEEISSLTDAVEILENHVAGVKGKSFLAIGAKKIN